MKRNMIVIGKWLSLALFVMVALMGIKTMLFDVPSLLPIFIFYGAILCIILGIYKWKKEAFKSYLEPVKKVKLNYFVIALLGLALAMLFYDIIVIGIHYGMKSFIILCFLLPYIYFSKKEQKI